jgi:nicotinate-nucleotide adenylyltransferase
LRRIGLFGGSFDPVHNAHVALARSALEALALDEVRWIPAGHPWQKTRTLADAAHRQAMVALAIEDEPRFVLDPIELQRPGPSYMLDTVTELQAAQPDAQWRSAPARLAMCTRCGWPAASCTRCLCRPWRCHRPR